MTSIAECGMRNAEWKTINPKSKIRTPCTRGATRNRWVLAPQSKGFTLLEVMVAVVIMATVLVSLIGLKNKSMQDVMLAEHITTGTLLAKRMMVETITKKPQTVEEEGDFPDEENYKGYIWKRTVSNIPLPNGSTIMEVRIAILWKEGTRQEQVELVSYE